LAATVLSTLPVAPGVAQSLDGIVVPAQSCTTINCKSLAYSGRINGFSRPSSGGTSLTANPWIASFSPGPVDGLGCLRFDVTSEQDDLAMAVIGPDRVVFTNDDSGCNDGSPRCPQVVVRQLSQGFYTLVINHFSGASVDSGFSLHVGRYTKTANPNCAKPTSGRLVEATAKDRVVQGNR